MGGYNQSHHQSNSVQPKSITEMGIHSMAPVKSFPPMQARINHLHYSEDGRHLIASSDDEAMTLYDCASGNFNRTINSKKYGANLVHFVRGSNDVITASTKIDNTIRYLSLSNNQYLRYFVGHSKPVVTLRMSPTEEMFLSGGMDNTIRLWDLRVSTCQGVMNLPSLPIASFDPEGLIFAVGMNSDTIKLYDVRTFDKGPFETFTIKQDDGNDAPWTNMSFSPDGRHILVMTSGEYMRLVDAFSGDLVHTLVGHKNDKNIALTACFSPCSGYVFCGGTDTTVVSWNRDNGKPVNFYASDHTGPVEHVLFNPKYYVLASACSHLRLWTPSD
ncbi:WD repeat-containing protein 82 [Aphelenchoides besseyi]|nr:WD repeat-containing protein 82 [Aphelenchoides besseyi]